MRPVSALTRVLQHCPATWFSNLVYRTYANKLQLLSVYALALWPAAETWKCPPSHISDEVRRPCALAWSLAGSQLCAC